MDVEQFVNEITKPLFVWRMARSAAEAFERGDDSPMARSGAVRYTNAEDEIIAIVRRYGAEPAPTATVQQLAERDDELRQLINRVEAERPEVREMRFQLQNQDSIDISFTWDE